MEVDWVCKRAHLRALLPLHPDWSQQQLADAVGCSKSMVNKWKRRFRVADSHSASVLFSRSRAPHRHPARLAEEVVERIMEIRLCPPEHLKRTPGPKAILYYLGRDETDAACVAYAYHTPRARSGRSSTKPGSSSGTNEGLAPPCHSRICWKKCKSISKMQGRSAVIPLRHLGSDSIWWKSAILSMPVLPACGFRSGTFRFSCVIRPLMRWSVSCGSMVSPLCSRWIGMCGSRGECDSTRFSLGSAPIPLLRWGSTKRFAAASS
jgi:hypothetical protein